MFAEQLGVLDHGALERLKNDATLFQLIRNHVTPKQLVTSENHAASDFIKPVRSFQNPAAFFLGQCSPESERREIEKTDISKSPGLIFSRRLRQRLKLFPGRALLIAEPVWKFTQLGWTGKDRSGFDRFVVSD